MIPDVPKKALLDVLERFDRELRDTEDWRDWEQQTLYRWAILHEGRRYPVKLVVELATGTPRATFSGGRQENEYMRSKGLEIVELRPSPRRAWIFQSNPDIFDLPGACKELGQVHFSVKRSRDEVQIGDRVYLWESGPEGGIVAVGTILTNPTEQPMPDRERRFIRDDARLANISTQAAVEVVFVVSPTLRRDRIRAEAELENLSILRFAQRTNFPVSQSEQKALDDLLQDHMDGTTGTDAPSALDRKTRRRSSAEAAGTTFAELLPDSSARRAFVELLGHAVRKAHELRPAAWATTLHPRTVRLNVGRNMALDVTHRGVSIYLDANGLSPEVLARLDPQYRRPRDREGFPGFRMPIDVFLEVAPHLEEALDLFLDHALERWKRSPYQRSHSPGVLEYIRQELGVSIPDPDHERGQDSNAPDDACFTWLDIYQELADKLVEYKDRQPELLDLLEGLQAEGVRIMQLADHFPGGRTGRLEEIDPFTFFASFNRGIRDRDRVAILRRCKEYFELEAELPRDFQGIPIANNMSSWFFAYAKNREPDAIASLWALARQVVRGGASAIEADTFDRCLGHLGIGVAKLTMGLFWLAPEEFLPLDKNTRAELAKHGIDGNGRTWAEYQALLSSVTQRFDSLPELSLAAWKGTHVVDDAEVPAWKIAPETGGRLWEDWLTGGYASIGWSELGDLTEADDEEFDRRAEKLLTEHPDRKRAGMNQVRKFRSIPVGTRIVANQGTSRVLGIGTVIGGYYYEPDEKDHHPHRLLVRWDDKRPREVNKPGWRRTLIPLTAAEFDELLKGAPEEPKKEVKKSGTGLDFDGILSALENEGLQFSPEVVASYLLALQTKRFVILSGISGTGKTQLAKAVAVAFQEEPETTTRSLGESRGTPRRVYAYMSKHHRFVLPRSFLEEQPEFLDAAADGRIAVRVPGSEPIEQGVHRRPDTGLFTVLMSGPVQEWFDTHLQEGDTVFMDVETDSHGTPSILSLWLPPFGAPEEPTYEIIPVRPDWTDARGLLGFHNPLLRSYVMTPTLRLILRAQAEVETANREGRDPKPYFLILDEMNLARVEHYFSDFLSAMESKKAIPLHEDARLESENDDDDPVPRRLLVPCNLYVTGTVNVDETTYMFSPKVLDRAFTLEFNEVDLDGFRSLDETNSDEGDESPLALSSFDGGLRGAHKPDYVDWEALRAMEGGSLNDAIRDLNALLEPNQRHFGYRVATEMARFISLAHAQAGNDPETLRTATDLAILSKVLVKLHGTQQELEDVLQDLQHFCVHGKAPAPKLSTSPEPTAEPDSLPLAQFPRSAKKLDRMLRRLQQQGFTSFIE